MGDTTKSLRAKEKIKLKKHLKGNKFVPLADPIAWDQWIKTTIASKLVKELFLIVYFHPVGFT
jgi:hypothetical protein